MTGGSIERRNGSAVIERVRLLTARVLEDFREKERATAASIHHGIGQIAQMLTAQESSEMIVLHRQSIHATGSGRSNYDYRELRYNPQTNTLAYFAFDRPVDEEFTTDPDTRPDLWIDHEAQIIGELEKRLVAPAATPSSR